MPSRRFLAPLVLLLATAACGAGEAAIPPAALEPEPAPADTVAPLPVPEPAAAPEPQPTLQERWGAPFAVRSSGRPAAREPRSVVVLSPAAPARAVAPAAVAVAEAEGVRESAAAAAVPAARAERAASGARPASASRRPAAAVRTHRVEWGETWYGIARRYSVAPSALAAANPEVEPERLRTGTALRIPAADAAAARAARSQTHRVGAGDTLWGIARRYGVSMQRLREANRLADDRVRLGQTLTIPPAEEGER